MNQVAVFIIAFMATLCFVTQIAEAHKKGDVIVVAGEKGCGPQLLLKTDKKKNLLIMNPCQKKKYEYPSYYKEESYDGHDGGYDMGYDMGSHEGGYQDSGSSY